jgi:hypothetical protein
VFSSGKTNACSCLWFERYELINGHCAEYQNSEIYELDSSFFRPWRRTFLVL